MSTCCQTWLPGPNCTILPEKTPLWKYCHKSSFCENIGARRSNGSIGYAEWLLSIGNEVASPDSEGHVLMGGLMTCGTIEEIVDCLYTPAVQYQCNREGRRCLLASRAILAAKNDMVDDINKVVCAQFPGDMATVYSADTAEKGGEMNPSSSSRSI